MYSFKIIFSEKRFVTLRRAKAERVAKMKRGEPYKWQNEK